MRSSRWMLVAALFTTIATCADAALLAVSSGNDRWLYGAGIILWVCLAAYYWNRWSQVRRA
jgi:hypothetical protein